MPKTLKRNLAWSWITFFFSFFFLLLQKFVLYHKALQTCYYCICLLTILYPALANLIYKVHTLFVRDFKY